MHATVLVIVIFLGPLVFAPEIATNSNNPIVTHQIVSNPTEYAPAATNVADDRLNVLKRNWDFEEADSSGGPADWDYYGSAWSRRNSSYQDLVANGSYSGQLQAKGLEQDDSSTYMAQYISGLSASIDETLTMEFWWWVESMSSYPNRGRCYFNVGFYNGSNYYLTYYLTIGSSWGSNSSTTTSYLLNESLQEWNHFERNLLDDFNARAGWSASSNLYIDSIYFQIQSFQNADDVTEMIIDDVAITNDTAYDYLQTRNGNFEEGGGAYWSGAGDIDPGYVKLTDDSLHGDKAVNITAASTKNWAQSNSYLSCSFGNPLGVTPYTSDYLLLDFDWKYQDVYNGDYQAAWLNLYFSNDTYWSSVRIYLGSYLNASIESNYTQPTYSYYYFEAEGIGIRDEWVHLHLDVYDLVTAMSFSNIGLTSLELASLTDGYANASVQLLADSYRILTYATGHPGFEMEDDGRSASYPIPGWYNVGTLSYINHTHISRSGNWAANITPAAGFTSRIRRSMEYQLDRNSFLDCWWRIEQFATVTSGYSYLEFSFEGGYTLRYFLAMDSDLSYSNSSYTAYYILADLNTTSTWIHTLRNMTNDLNSSFGFHKWNATQVELDVYSDGSGITSVLFDDVNVIDALPPSGIPSVSNPVYYSPTTVEIQADDNRAGVKEVTVYYDDGSGWNDIQASYEDNHWVAEIPMLPWSTTVDYYALITDYSSQTTVSDNGGSYYSFTVGDDITPSVTLNAPLDESEIVDTIILNASASDEGSGIDRVEFLVDSTSIANVTSAPFTVLWDSRTVSNGTHILTARAYDREGLDTEEYITVDIQNDVESPLTYSLMLNPSVPVYGQITMVSVTVLDDSSIKNVTLYYAIESYSSTPSLTLSQDWIAVGMDADGPVFSGIIPEQEYWHTVLYYVVAYDVYDQATYIGTSAEPLEFNVGDIVDPTLNVNGPIEGSSVKGFVQFLVSAADEGSGIEHVRFSVDSILIDSDTEELANFTWDTTQQENGEHTVIIEAEDYAGNIYSISLDYTVANPDMIGAIVDSLSETLSTYGFFVGAGTVIIIFVIAKIVSRRRNK